MIIRRKQKYWVLLNEFKALNTHARCDEVKIFHMVVSINTACNNAILKYIWKKIFFSFIFECWNINQRRRASWKESIKKESRPHSTLGAICCFYYYLFLTYRLIKLIHICYVDQCLRRSQNKKIALIARTRKNPKGKMLIFS